MTTKKQVVGYTRVSTDGQIDKFGLDAQREMIQTYCDEHGYEIVKWYVEQGVSGVKDARPEFDKLLYGEIENPPICAVIVAKNDRVARDINVYYYFKMLLRKKNIDLVSVSEDFGDMGIMASFLEAFTLCVAQMERENITRRTSAGREMKARKGGYAGGRVAYGYKVHNKEWVIDPEQAECVRKIFAMRESGMKLTDICNEVIKLGYKTQTGKEFTISTIQNVLKNERVYRGQMNYGGVYTGKQERIL